MNGMTIRQIAALCNVSESTVLNWAWKAAAKSGPGIAPEETPIGKKLVASGHGKPATLWIDEVLESVRAGGNNTLADLLEQNAGQKPAISSPDLPAMMRELVPLMAAAMTTALAPLLRELRQPLPVGPQQPRLALPATSPTGDYCTIKAYGNKRGVQINRTNAVNLGREASRLSRERNVEIRKIEDDQWGQVNAYHASVLQEVFTI